MKAYVTKLIAKLKSSDNVWHGNKLYYFVDRIHGRC